MNSNATQATALAAGGLSAGAVSFLVWIAKTFFHIDIPAEQAAFLVALMGGAAHWAALRWGVPPVPSQQQPASQPAPVQLGQQSVQKPQTPADSRAAALP